MKPSQAPYRYRAAGISVSPFLIGNLLSEIRSMEHHVLFSSFKVKYFRYCLFRFLYISVTLSDSMRKAT